MKFSKPFLGVKNGDVYPTEFRPGDECPAELIEAATELGALEKATKSAAKVKRGGA